MPSSSAAAGHATGLFPPQGREWGLPAQAPGLTPKAAERVALEAATASFGEAARKLNHDWGTHYDGKQMQRISEAVGQEVARQRDQESKACAAGQRPTGPANDPVLLTVQMDGGRVQGREKNLETGSRWKEDKVAAITTYLPGDGKGKEPVKLNTTYVATMGNSDTFGPLVRCEAERRGIRQATQTILLNDGGAWIDTQRQEHFVRCPMVIDWGHACEHLYDVAAAAHEHDEPRRQRLGEQLEAWLWDGQRDQVIGRIRELSLASGPPQEQDAADHPRRVLAQNVGYFERHREHMDYPTYRAKGWPIGSGVVESAVKQFNKRVKGTEQFWSTPGGEAILALRALWMSEDERWDHYWLWGRLPRCAA